MFGYKSDTHKEVEQLKKTVSRLERRIKVLEDPPRFKNGYEFSDDEYDFIVTDATLISSSFFSTSYYEYEVFNKTLGCKQSLTEATLAGKVDNG